MEIQANRSGFQAASAKLRRHFFLVRFASLLRKSHLLFAIAALISLVILRTAAGWGSGEWSVAIAITVLWLIVTLVLAQFRLPDERRLFLLLDRRGGWKDCFASAWEFLNVPSPSEAHQLHLQRARSNLDLAIRSFPRNLPVPSMRWVWIAPFCALLLSVTPWLRLPPDARELELSEKMKSSAALQAEELKSRIEKIRSLRNLSEEESRAIEKLTVEVDSIAEKLADPDGLTAGEMLKSLEEGASAAEKLAGALDPFSDDWASEAMLLEMAQHPDTADLALYLQDKSAAPSAEESARLQVLLEDLEIKPETENRITGSLERIMQAALEIDLTRPVGERFGNASRKMLDDQTRTAAREFEELAKHFRELAGREDSKQKLDELAEALREAGGEISGSELQKSEKMAGNSSARNSRGDEGGLQHLDADSSGGDQEHKSGIPLPGEELQGLSKAPTPLIGKDRQAEEMKPPVPGMANSKGEAGEGKKGEENFAAPVPCEQSPEGQSGAGIGMSEKTQEGEGEGGMLSAPVPGMEPGESSEGSGSAMNLSGGNASQSGRGGDQAGVGTAELSEEDSERLEAGADAKVVAQSLSTGDSTIRSIEGEARAEAAGRDRQEIISDFISVEEQALDEQSLPFSRKQHVLRYFSAIRDQFEAAADE